MSLSPSTADSSTVPQQSADTQHNFTLDVVGGLALLGLLVVSVWEFGGFTANQQLYYQTGTHGGNFKLLTTISMLFDGKMLSLLAMVFGAGIILFVQKKEHPVEISAADAHIRRMMWLMGFGVINAFLLVWPGDILFQFGVLGILLFAFTRMKSRGFFIAAIVCTFIYCGKQYWYYSDDKNVYKKYTAIKVVEDKFKADSTIRAKKDSTDRTKDTVLLKDTLLRNKLNDSLAKKNDTLTSQQQEDKGNWEGTVKRNKYDAGAAKENNKTMQARNWKKIAYASMQKTQQKESYWLYRIGIWDIGSMMFLGMALMSIGYFSPRFSSSKYLVVGLLALIAGTLLAWYRIHYQSLKLADYAVYIKEHSIPFNQFLPIEKLLMALGYASLVLWFLRMSVFGWIWKAAAAVGRLALTNYIIQTVVCTLFFYGYGFGYFGRLKQWELYFFVAELAMVQIVFSVMWLRYFTMGPVEWLLRTLVYRKRLPIKRVPGAEF